MNLQALIPTALSFGSAALIITLLILSLFQLNWSLIKRDERTSPKAIQRQLTMLAVSIQARTAGQAYCDGRSAHCR
jgi:hypothetical protein